MNVTAGASDSGFDSKRFFARVQSAAVRVLMLDYDGTLAPFHVDPAQAEPYAGVLPLLDAMMDAGHTRLIIVTGRSINDILPLLKLKRLPEVWGSHGLERRHANGDYQPPQISAVVLNMLATADRWASELEALGARVERKPGSVAFHWRGCANHQIAGIRSKLLEKWVEFGRCKELAWHDFDGGIELRAHERDKGDVVRKLAAEVGPDAAFCYMGDDLTDEDAFRAVPDEGVSVLVRPQYRPTAANLWISPPHELLQFLARWHETASVTR